jgi:hypothetical protein
MWRPDPIPWREEEEEAMDTDESVSRNNGCGTLVHTHVARPSIPPSSSILSSSASSALQAAGYQPPTREWIGRGAPEECVVPMEEAYFAADTNLGTEGGGNGPDGELGAEQGGYGGIGKSMFVKLGCGCETEGVGCAVW